MREKTQTDTQTVTKWNRKNVSVQHKTFCTFVLVLQNTLKTGLCGQICICPQDNIGSQLSQRLKWILEVCRKEKQREVFQNRPASATAKGTEIPWMFTRRRLWWEEKKHLRFHHHLTLTTLRGNRHEQHPELERQYFFFVCFLLSETVTNCCLVWNLSLC